MNEKLYRVDQFYPGDFAQILTGVYIYRGNRHIREENSERIQEFGDKMWHEEEYILADLISDSVKSHQGQKTWRNSLRWWEMIYRM